MVDWQYEHMTREMRVVYTSAWNISVSKYWRKTSVYVYLQKLSTNVSIKCTMNKYGVYFRKTKLLLLIVKINSFVHIPIILKSQFTNMNCLEAVYGTLHTIKFIELKSFKINLKLCEFTLLTVNYYGKVFTYLKYLKNQYQSGYALRFGLIE